VLHAKWNYADWYQTGGFQLTIARKPLTHLPSYPLKNYSLAWELRDGEGKLLHNGNFAIVDLDSEQTLKADWTPDPKIHHATLRLTLTNPRGETELQRTLNFLYPVADGQEIDEMTLPSVKP